MRIVITGGGTGGHVYPAIAIAHALKSIHLSQAGPPSSNGRQHASILYVGSNAGLEAVIVAREGLPFAYVQAQALRGRPLFRALVNLVRLGWGFIQSYGLLRRFRPQVILATGGYVCVPVVLAGWVRRIPTLLYLPDIRPGWAVRFLARFARLVAVTSEWSKQFLPSEKVVETGYPVRPQLSHLDKATSRQKLGLDPDWPLLIIWGGSQGAHSINRAVSKCLPELLRLCQVLHICGHEDEVWLKEFQRNLPTPLAQRYLVYSYLHAEMPLALAAADLAVSRAGAATLGEFPAVGLPSILIPYPFAGGHQHLNADFMVQHGAAVKLDNDELDQLFPTVRRLLQDSKLLATMAARAKSLARPSAAEELARLLCQIAQSEAS